MGLFKSSWERQVDNNLFDYIDIEQFRNFRASTLWNYFTMWFLLLLHTTLYGVDVYTCIRLLAFNTWSSQVQPYLPFRISKWLFAACIICSIVLLIFETLRGIRVYRTRNISLIYTNPFARKAKSISGYNYFCVLNEINPTGRFQKMAFYTFFTIHGSMKLLLADSPRQVINALTLWTVLNVETGFWKTIRDISIYNRNEALILYGMAISFFIWTFFIAELFFSVIFAFPVYYRILHTMRYQTLRQYVCITVDKAVKKLARLHQKKSLQKLIESKSDMSLFEKPSLPDVDIPETPTEKFKPRIVESATFNSSSTISLPDYTTINENPFDDEQEKRTVQEVTKPLHIHHKGSNISLLTRYNDFPIASSTYGDKPRYSGSIDETSGVEGFVDEDKGFVTLSDHSTEDLTQIVPTEKEDMVSRKHVRPSLILRAKEMETEDYSRFVSRSFELDLENNDGSTPTLPRV